VKCQPPALPGRKTSPLYTSVGSRKNLFELAGISAETSILNTPVKIAAEKVGTFTAAPPRPSPLEVRKPLANENRKPVSNENRKPVPSENRKLNENTEPVIFDPSLCDARQNGADFQPRLSGLVRPKPVSYQNSGIDFSSTRNLF
jgi:hypothetical protein